MKTETGNNLLTLKLFNFFLYGSMSILFSFFPLYFQAVGFSTVVIGMLMAGGTVCFNIRQSVLGILE